MTYANPVPKRCGVVLSLQQLNCVRCACRLDSIVGPAVQFISKALPDDIRKSNADTLSQEDLTKLSHEQVDELCHWLIQKITFVTQVRPDVYDVCALAKLIHATPSRQFIPYLFMFKEQHYQQ